ncbi:hypothetical protein [Pseudophaeobacter leonis]|uniref:hypothetical protein n=1 Tax=Pseudophaeobacter leonis TaxID=1144477 RepID=UPI0009F63B0D|nr:hypothetical protein [Pseudophaeobacter leonis]
MKFVKLIASGVMATLLATAAVANDDGNQTDAPIPGAKGFVFYNQVGEWRVLQDIERNTCMVEKFDVAGNAVQIGLGPRGKRAYLGIFTKLPEELRGQGDKQVVTVEVNGTTYKGRIKRAHRKAYTAYSGIYIPARNLDIAALATDGKQTMDFPNAKLEVNFSMAGAVAAVAVAKECHASLNS